jgi:hypothetical protein
MTVNAVTASAAPGTIFARPRRIGWDPATISWVKTDRNRAFPDPTRSALRLHTSHVVTCMQPLAGPHRPLPEPMRVLAQPLRARRHYLGPVAPVPMHRPSRFFAPPGSSQSSAIVHKLQLDAEIFRAQHGDDRLQIVLLRARHPDFVTPDLRLDLQLGFPDRRGDLLGLVLRNALL